MNKTLCSATLALSMVLLGGCSTVPTNLSSIELALAQQGTLAVGLDLPAVRSTQALPENTQSVTISVTGASLNNPISQTITRSQFVNNHAELRIDKLPPGDIQVSAVILDASGNQVALGNATATIVAGSVTPIALNLAVKGATGGATIAIDGRTVYDDPVVTIPVATQSLTITAATDTSDTPDWTLATHVSLGQRLGFSTTGRVGYSYSGYNYDYYDALGYNTSSYTGGLVSTQPALALVGKFVPDGGGTATYFLAGKSGSFTALAAGTVYIGINTWTSYSSSRYFAGSYVVTFASR